MTYSLKIDSFNTVTKYVAINGMKLFNLSRCLGILDMLQCVFNKRLVSRTLLDLSFFSRD